jgi:hypothetical protein
MVKLKKNEQNGHYEVIKDDKVAGWVAPWITGGWMVSIGDVKVVFKTLQRARKFIKATV